MPAAILRAPVPSVNDSHRPSARTCLALLLILAIGAFCSRDRVSSADVWTIGNARIQAELRLASDGLLITSVVNPQTGAVLNAGDAPDSAATVNGTTAALGASA